jgi:hypothetical protein
LRHLAYCVLAHQAKQKASDWQGFSRLVRNFSSKEARFDSKTEPLFRLFNLLPVAIDTLKTLAEGRDGDDARPAAELLRHFGGAAGYCRLVSAAVVADGMMVIGKFINKSQVACASYMFCVAMLASQVQLLRLGGGVTL